MQKRILFIGHDANYAGAQYLLFNLLNYLKDKNEVKTALLLVKGGQLVEEYSKITQVINLENKENKQGFNFLKNNKSNALISEEQYKKIQSFDPTVVFSNTIANGEILLELKPLDCPFIIYCHELEKSIQLYSTPELMKFQLENAKAIFAGSNAVKSNLIENHHVNGEKITVFHSQIDCNNIESKINSVNKASVKRELGIPEDAIIIGGCANAEWRKGLDIFILVSKQILKITTKKVHFIWVGISESHLEYYNINYDLTKMGISDKVHLLESTSDYIQYLACFDIFFLSSREDPYPLVMIEAGMNKIPIVAFEKSGGSNEFIDADLELIVPYLDVTEAAILLNKLAENDAVRKELGEKIYLKSKEHDVFTISEKILKSI